MFVCEQKQTNSHFFLHLVTKNRRQVLFEGKKIQYYFILGYFVQYLYWVQILSFTDWSLTLENVSLNSKVSIDNSCYSLTYTGIQALEKDLFSEIFSAFGCFVLVSNFRFLRYWFSFIFHTTAPRGAAVRRTLRLNLVQLLYDWIAFKISLESWNRSCKLSDWN